ncbi:MAG: hypothetical protein GC154_06110 [bacterium]|nr:hypothetical protein [bacterium]
MLESAWNSLNNRKTNIGAGLLLAAVVMQNVAGIWTGANAPEWIPKAVETMNFIGSLMAGVGLGHKGVKALKGETAKNPAATSTPQ